MSSLQITSFLAVDYVNVATTFQAITRLSVCVILLLCFTKLRHLEILDIVGYNFNSHLSTENKYLTYSTLLQVDYNRRLNIVSQV